MIKSQDILALAVAGVAASGAHAPALQWRRTGQRYDHVQRCVAEVEVDGAQVKLRFELPAGVAVDHVRLVPAALPGDYEIGFAKASGVLVKDLAERAMAVDGERLQAAPGRLRWRNWRRAASLEFDVRGLPSESFEFHVRREGDHDSREHLSQHIQELASRFAASEARLADAQMALSIRIERLAAFGERSGAALSEDVAALSRNVGEHSAGQATRLEKLEGALQEQSQNIDVVKQAGDAQARMLAGLHSTSHAHSELMAGTQSALQAQLMAAADLNSNLQAQAVKLADLERSLERLANNIENVFWRRWLRRLRGGMR